MHISVISLFPEMFNVLDFGVVGRAKTNKLLRVDTINPRDFTEDAYHRVDDRPYGGGPGMVMMAEPLQRAIDAAKNALPRKVIYLSPKGKPLQQSMLAEAASSPGFIFLAGRYEEIDQRLIDTSVDELWSLGDYVLSGGELAAMVVIDGIARLLPGVLGSTESAVSDSFQNGILDHPHYTRPEVWRGLGVPAVLLSGDHQAIAAWREQQALALTKQNRPDLMISLLEGAKHE